MKVKKNKTINYSVLFYIMQAVGWQKYTEHQVEGSYFICLTSNFVKLSDLLHYQCNINIYLSFID